MKSIRVSGRGFTGILLGQIVLNVYQSETYPISLAFGCRANSQDKSYLPPPVISPVLSRRHDQKEKIKGATSEEDVRYPTSLLPSAVSFVEKFSKERKLKNYFIIVCVRTSEDR